MITGKHIHNWLQEPETVNTEDCAAILELQAQFPYFAPSALLYNFQQKGCSRDLEFESLFQYNPIIYLYWKQAENWPTSAKPRLWTEVSDDLLTHEKEGAGSDYFENVPDNLNDFSEKEDISVLEEDRSLLVVMSFAEWLQFLQKRTLQEQEEEADKRALRAQWQKLKMAEAIEEENEEIPENVFEMAVNSISREEGSVVSESMAVVYAKQGKKEEAIAIYRKLSLNNPEKSSYFADKINNLK